AHEDRSRERHASYGALSSQLPHRPAEDEGDYSMIYDRILTVYDLTDGDSPLSRRLIGGRSYYYAEQEVFASRYYAARQSGDRISVLVEILQDPQITRIKSDLYAVLGPVGCNGNVYRIAQSQYGRNDDGLPVTRLSLVLMEGKYDILKS
ncbi:MAG: hypothetical protein RR340_11975, partial [Cloacibacillus sp.]